MVENIIEINGVSKTYGTFRALDNISLNIPMGSVFGLLGPNGAGKTTLIRIITQIIGPDSGTVLMNGVSLKPTDISRIGYMPEERGLYKKMKVGEQVLYMARLKGMSRKEAQDAMNNWFKVFNIESWVSKKTDELSKGMQQKVQFISTIIHKPKLLILDEPFSGFDPINSELIKDELLRLKSVGTTIMLSTHRMESVEELCDHMGMINLSHIVISGKVKDVIHKFKRNHYELFISPKSELPVSYENFNIESITPVAEEENLKRIILSPKSGIPTSNILKYFLSLGEIHGFRELLPTINDIFIQLVKEKGTNQ